ncbi:MAG TPA: sigma factor-like helix-turn-helix DNA-binding protein [Dehalococcoidia bacterium]|nr:sigma factor-like helix-turn-helix DNA-binding protein [Dehalococcoidia bacterium]
MLRDVHDLSYEEIAQATETSLGTVKSRISRARERARSILLRNRELLPPQFRQ